MLLLCLGTIEAPKASNGMATSKKTEKTKEKLGGGDKVNEF